MTVPVGQIAHARSGDKGDTRNIGVTAYDTWTERAKRLFGGLARGPVERFELLNPGALNLLLHQLPGGVP